MKLEFWQLVLSALSGTAVSEAVRYIFQRKKDNADTEITLSSGWRDYADELKERLEALEREYWPLKEENLKLRAKLAEMEREMDTIKKQII